MNKDQVKGATKNSVGKIQRVAGKLVGSQRQQLKGTAKQIAGKAQQRFGDFRAAAKTARKKDGR